jgi:hypothetical protein
VKIVSIPDWPGEGCSNEGMTPSGQLLVPGAIEPDWGPADVPPDRVIANDHDGHTKSKLTLKVSRAKLRQALRRGLKLQVTVPQAGKLTASARRGRVAVASGRGRAKAAGLATITLRFTKKAKRTLARSRRAKLTVKVGFTANGAKKAEYATTAISLR